MTPSEYLARINFLVSAEQWHEALAFAEARFPDVSSELSTQELNRLYGTMEMVMNLIEIEESMEPAPPVAPAVPASPADLDSAVTPP